MTSSEYSKFYCQYRMLMIRIDDSSKICQDLDRYLMTYYVKWGQKGGK